MTDVANKVSKPFFLTFSEKVLWGMGGWTDRQYEEGGKRNSKDC